MEGRLFVVNVVPVVRGIATTADAEVNWNDGRDGDAVLLSDDRRGALVESGPRVWIGWDSDLLSDGDGSSSSSESESSPSDSSPTVEGLLNGESGLSGPSSSSSSSSSSPGMGIVFAGPS